MKKNILFCTVIFLFGCNSDNQSKNIYAKIEINEKDSTFKALTVSDSVVFDLKHCAEFFDYPPHIPAVIYWTKPNILKPEETGEYGLLNMTYHFDEKNRLTVYYYQGSVISGVFPLIYIFKYVNDDSYLINEIEDPFYKIKYKIEYDSMQNVKFIEKLDSLNQQKEKLTIKIK